MTDSSTIRRAVLAVFGHGVSRARGELHDNHFHLSNYIQEGPESGHYLWAGENTGWQLSAVRVAGAIRRLSVKRG